MSKNSQPAAQFSYIDQTPPLTQNQLKRCQNSFYGTLRETFLTLDGEKFFGSLSKDSTAGRKPINPMFKIMALIIKVVNNLSYEELEDRLEFDRMVKYAFGYEYKTSKPVSTRTLRLFLLQLREYQLETGRDLLNEFFTQVSAAMAELIKANPNQIRIDSTFIESSIRHLSRLEIIFESINRAVKFLKKEGIPIDKSLQEYLAKDTPNRLFYYKEDQSEEELSEKLLADAQKALDLFDQKQQDNPVYQTLSRVLEEQSCLNDQDKRVLKPAREVGSDSVQSPVDPDATFRSKAGKGYKGYLGTDAEVSNGHESIVIKSRTDKNNRSDSNILKEMLPELKGDETKDLIADGAYGSKENIKLASENNINLYPTSLPGRPTSEIHAAFTLNEEGTKVLLCPNGKKPKTTTFNKKNNNIYFSMAKKVCDKCPLKDQCCVKANKNVKNPRTLRGITSATCHSRAFSELNLTEDEKQTRKKQAHFRNGVEALFNDLKRNGGLEAIGSQLRGLLRTGLENTLAVLSHNLRSIFKYKKRNDYCPVSLAFLL